MEEVSTLRPEGAQEIINHCKPFNRGESSAADMEQLYPTLLRMPVAVRVEVRVKNMPSQSLPMLVRKISSWWLKMAC